MVALAAHAEKRRPCDSRILKKHRLERLRFVPLVASPSARTGDDWLWA